MEEVTAKPTSLADNIAQIVLGSAEMHEIACVWDDCACFFATGPAVSHMSLCIYTGGLFPRLAYCQPLLAGTSRISLKSSPFRADDG